MEKIIRTAMLMSLIFLCIAFAGSMYFSFPHDDYQQVDGTFIMMDCIIGLAILWFAFNLWKRSKGEE